MSFASPSTVTLPAFASGLLLSLLGHTIELNGHWMNKADIPLQSPHLHLSAL